MGDPATSSFLSDPFELHHQGLWLHPDQRRMALGEQPEFVMVPQIIPDPMILREEGTREPMYGDPSWLLVPAAMKVEPITAEIEEALDEHYQHDWRRLYSVVGIAFDPASEYLGYDWWEDECPWQPVRLHSCMPITPDDADDIRREGRRVIQGGWWACAWALLDLQSQYADSTEALALAAREIPDGLSIDKVAQLQAEADRHLDAALEMEYLESLVYRTDGSDHLTDEDLRFELHPQLENTWRRVLNCRARALDALPAFVPDKNDLRIERIYHTWA